MGMMILGRSCSAEGVVRRVAVGPSRSEIAPLHFSVAKAGSASAGIAAYHGTRIADAIVIAAAARQLESQLTTTFAAHALGRGPARRYAIYPNPRTSLVVMAQENARSGPIFALVSTRMYRRFVLPRSLRIFSSVWPRYQ